MPLIQLKTQVQGTIWTELDDSRLYKQVSNIFTTSFQWQITKTTVDATRVNFQPN